MGLRLGGLSVYEVAGRGGGGGGGGAQSMDAGVGYTRVLTDDDWAPGTFYTPPSPPATRFTRTTAGIRIKRHMSSAGGAAGLAAGADGPGAPPHDGAPIDAAAAPARTQNGLPSPAAVAPAVTAAGPAGQVGNRSRRGGRTTVAPPTLKAGGAGDGPPPRVAFVGKRRHENRFATNEIVTSKYTVWSFIPRSLFEQFRRIANVYFLVCGLLMLVGTYFPQVFNSPLSAYSTLGPLVLVLGITMIKEAAEDVKRHTSDHRVNNRMITVLRDGQEVEIRWIDITVGDLVKINCYDEVPADMIIVWSSEHGGQCYTETSNIDGESNLKIRSAVHLAGISTVADLKSWDCELTYEAPNASIHTFEGRIEHHGTKYSVEPKNVLLRGCMLRNTRCIYGAVVYTGGDTKVMRKAGGARSKMSQVEITVNRCIRVIFLTQACLCTAHTICVEYWNSGYLSSVPYLQLASQSYVIPTWIANWLTFLMLYNNFIPISLYVTIEMTNYFQAFLIDSDIEMVDPETETPAKARTSNLNADLGQIQYVFSDKTGTLTRNEMAFQRCSIAGKAYCTQAPPLLQTKGKRLTATARSFNIIHDEALVEVLQSPDHADFDPVVDFFRCVALCHTVVVERDSDTPTDGAPDAAVPAGDSESKLPEHLTPENVDFEYQAESPDEGALTAAAATLGFVYMGRSATAMTLKTPLSPTPEVYKVHGVHEFNADRKRMSIIVETPDGRYLLLCKGADNIIFSLSASPEHHVLNAHLEQFASAGLRTLVLAQKELTPDEFQQWQEDFRSARNQVNGREAALGRVAADVEQQLTVLGATAIEDKLQEGVPQTLRDLNAAGIKTWVLTGDKVETAINIGYSCALLDKSMDLIKLISNNEDDVDRQLSLLVHTFGGLVENPRGAIRRIAERVTRLAQLQLKLPGRAQRAGSKSVPIQDLAAGQTSPEEGARPRSLGRQRSTSSDVPTGRELHIPREPSNEHLVVQADNLALVVSGDALHHILPYQERARAFLVIAQLCKCVIACRVSPSQKADLVKLVRNSITPRPMCLAIGDGANDVNMIQAAQVGIGISGKEGLQAVNASDFAIAQFRFLRRLLLVHGRWNYVRMAKVFLYSFYKNIVITMTLFLFSFYTGFSGTSLYESLVYSGFNFFLGMPIFIVGCLDRDISAQACLEHPQVYVSGRANMNLGLRKMMQWIVHAIIHGLIIFYLPYGLIERDQSLTAQGYEDGLFVQGTIVYTCLIFAMHWKLFTVATTWTWINWFFLIASVIGYFVFILVYSTLPSYSPDYYWVAFTLLSRPATWFALFLVLGACMLFDLSVELFRLTFLATEIDIAIEIDRGYGKWPSAAPSSGSHGLLVSPALAPSPAAAPALKTPVANYGSITAPEAKSQFQDEGAGTGASATTPRGRPRFDTQSVDVAQQHDILQSTGTGTFRLTRTGLDHLLSGVSGSTQLAAGYSRSDEAHRSGFDFAAVAQDMGVGAGDEHVRPVVELERAHSFAAEGERQPLPPISEASMRKLGRHHSEPALQQ